MTTRSSIVTGIIGGLIGVCFALIALAVSSFSSSNGWEGFQYLMFAVLILIGLGLYAYSKGAR